MCSSTIRTIPRWNVLPAREWGSVTSPPLVLSAEQLAAVQMVGTPQEVADRLHLYCRGRYDSGHAGSRGGGRQFEEYLDQFRRYVEQVIPCYERG